MLQILLVDDENYVVDDLEVSFPWSKYGIEKVHKAYSGAEALQIVSHTPIDIVITDISMPEMNGLQLIKRIRENNRIIKCILLTGYTEFNYAQEAIRQEVTEYLIKPLDRNQLEKCLETTIQAIKQQVEQVSSYEKAMLTFREQLPLLKDKLLNELIQGKPFSAPLLADKMEKYSLPFREEDEVFLLLIRLEEHFTRYGMDSLLLFEYAVTNIACELFGNRFDTWHCRDSYNYLVFVVKPTSGLEPPMEHDKLSSQLTQLSLQLHRNVNEYLKGGISVILTYGGHFSQDIAMLHHHAVTALRKQIGQEKGYFLAISKQSESSVVRSLNVLYEPPTFLHLLETGQWESFRERLARTQESLELLSEITEEHLDEIKSLMLSTFHYIAHKNNSLLSDLVGREMINRPPFRSLSQVIDWAECLAKEMQQKLEKEISNQQQDIIQVIQAFVGKNLSIVSLQSVADHVGLHPVYVSKLFKQIWGVSLSEYILGVKMDHAISLLRQSQDKVYEISEKLGYSNSQYFIKVFKEKYQMTPQEYRDRC